MTLTEWSFIFSIIALLISIWGRLEAFLISSRQNKVEQARRIGEALLSAQILKNTISNNIDEFEKVLVSENVRSLNVELIEEFSKQLSILEEEYKKIWESVKVFENCTLAIAKGQSLNIDAASTDATIAHFNQRKILAEFNVQYLNSFCQRHLNSASKT